MKIAFVLFMFMCVFSLMACHQKVLRPVPQEKAEAAPLRTRELATVRKFGIPRISQGKDAILVDLELASPTGSWSKEVEIKGMETGFVVRVWLTPLASGEEEKAVPSQWKEEVSIPVTRDGGFDIQVEGKTGKHMDIVFVD